MKRSREATVELNKAHWPVTVLGPGRRIGLWFQGCTIHCRGCVSQDTWPRDASKRIAVSALLDWCRKTAGKPDGITISGGEPFDQAAGLRALLRSLVQWRQGAGLDFDILCYSGYSLAKLERHHPSILALLDAVIPEPYAENKPLTHIWRGSANQTLVALSSRGREHYGPFVDTTAESQAKRMQLAVEGGRVWMIGIPARGDMARVETLCRERGLALKDVSWRR